MTDNPILAALHRRRSIRQFTEEAITTTVLHEIVQAGIWAPSGLNNQPWRFVIIQDDEYRQQLAAQTHYSHIIQGAPSLIAVFLDINDMYDATKDHQAAGACIQNMLLATEALGLGGVWLGQILKNKKNVNKILGLDDHLELMAVLAIGHPAHHNQQSQRKPLEHFIIKEI